MVNVSDLESALIELENAVTSAVGVGKESWTETEWLEHFQELEQYPEAAKAMKLYNSKLYKALK